MKHPVLFCLLISFLAAHTQERYQVIIQELMPDPSPSAGLPSNEWIEIRNRTAQDVDLQGWRILDDDGQSGPLPSYVLKPDSLLLICNSTAVPLMLAYGPAIGVSSFPSLNNEAGTISLRNRNGVTIHAVSYQSAWHSNTVKRDGGWSLEMIDPSNFCGQQSNWTSSTSNTGGSPGSVNSTQRSNPDISSPRLLRAYCDNNRSVVLVFDETIDSLMASALTAYTSADVLFLGADPRPPLFHEVMLRTADTLAASEVMEIKVNGVGDCMMNLIGDNKVRYGVASPLQAGQVVINEIMYNPPPSGYDYLELFNRGDKIIDLVELSVANRNSSGAVNDLVAASDGHYLLFPGDHYAVTSDPNRLALQYSTPEPDNIAVLPSLPSFPDDRGQVLLVDKQGTVLEELAYSDKWQFPLLNNTEGVSLERVNAGNTTEQANWHSAASSAGYGTPGYKNSQRFVESLPGSGIEISPKIFSPDNDGRDDLCFIRFTLPAPGFVANMQIYDARGNPVCRLVKGDLLAATGYWTWDGTDDHKKRLNTGPYILVTELFNLEGKTKKFKNVAVLVRR